MKRSLLLIIALILSCFMIFGLSSCRIIDRPDDDGTSDGGENNGQTPNEKPNEDTDPDGTGEDSKPTEQLAYTMSADGSYYTVTGIGSFTGTELVIPDLYLGLPVREIADSAFEGNTLITSVSFGINLDSIGSRAFFGCINITVLVIPDTVTVIGSYAFCGCQGLTDLKLGEGLETVGDSAFEKCSGLVRVIFGGKIKIIGSLAFYLCINVRYVYLPSTVISVGSMAFGGIPYVRYLSDGDSIPDNWSENWWGDGEFDCDSWFYGGYWEITVDGDILLYVGEWTVYIAPTCTEDGAEHRGCLTNEAGYVSKVIPATGHSMTYVYGAEPTCTTYGWVSHYYCENCYRVFEDEAGTRQMTDYIIPCPGHKMEGNTCTVCSKTYSDGFVFTLSTDKSYYILSDIGTCRDTDIVIPAKVDGIPVKEIGQNVFYGLAVTSVIIPEGVTLIDFRAFYRCEDLETVILPESLTTVKASAFESCYALKNLVIPSGVKTMDENSFGWLVNLENLYFGATEMEDMASGKYPFTCVGKNSGVNIVIGKNVKRIPASLFASANEKNVNKIVSLTFEEGSQCTSIGNYAFRYSGGDYALYIPDHITQLGNSVFSYNSGIKSVKIGRGLTELSMGLFSGCTSLTRITVPENIKIIGGGAFRDCEKLENIDLPSGLTQIGDGAFYQCVKLESICLPDGLISIEKNAFWSSGLKEIIIPDSVTDIGEDAFWGCEKLSRIHIGVGLVNIGRSAFGYCDSLSYIYFDAADMPDLNSKVYPFESSGHGGEGIQVVIGKDAAKIPAYLFMSYYSDDPLNVPNVVTVRFEEGSICREIGTGAFYSGTHLRSVILPDGLEVIGNSAFYRCRKLCSIVIPDSVKTVKSAFSECHDLMTVVIGRGVETIETNAFYNCYSLIEVYNLSPAITVTKGANDNGYLGYSAIDIYTGADSESKMYTDENGYVFYDIDGKYYLVGYSGTELDLVLPDSVKGESYAIYKYALYQDRDITSVVIPAGVTELGYQSFGACNSLKTVIILAEITEIPDYAFFGSSEISQIVIPKTVTRIGPRAFYYCNKLESVFYMGSPDEWTAISIDSKDNNYLMGAARYYYSETAPETEGNFWHYVDGVPTVRTADEAE